MARIRDGQQPVLLVIDAQNGVAGDAYKRDEVLANIGRLVDDARENSIPVIWVQHEDEEFVKGSETWQVVPELSPADGEPVVPKRYGDAFAETDLETHLAERGATRLAIVGGDTNWCVRSTATRALINGYDVAFVEDAHLSTGGTIDGVEVTGEQINALTNLYFTYIEWPGVTSEAITTEDLLCRDPAAAAD